MSSLAYLIRKSIKNRILDVVRSPAKLIIYLLVIGLILGFFVLSLFTQQGDGDNFMDLIWLKGMFFALIMISFISSVRKGLKSGDAIFSMNDANLLFVSPVSPRSILLYGVVRMMGMAFWAGFFILFQWGTLGAWFGINFGGLLLILLVYILAIGLLQIVSLLIYSLTNGNPKGKSAVRIGSVILFVPMMAAFAWHFIGSDGDIAMAAEALLRSPVTAWTPVVGWSASAVLAFFSGQIFSGLLFLGTLIAFGVILILTMLFSNPDYYEDVLVATETAFEKKRAVQEGTATLDHFKTAKKVTDNIKPLKGNGASALFYKHLRESFRASPLGIWGTWSILMVAGLAAGSFFIRMNNGGPDDMVILLQVVMWIQLFLVGTGRGVSELSSHYIYMIPAPPFTKLLWNNWEAIAKVTVESFVGFTAAGIILQASPLLIGAAIWTYIAFTLMLLGLNHLILRWAGLAKSAGILAIMYLLIVALIMLPGLVPALIIGVMHSTVIGISVLALWLMVAAFGCFWLSRGILHRCDMPSKSVWK